MRRYYPEGDIEDQLTGWNVNDLSRQNIMKQATALKKPGAAKLDSGHHRQHQPG
ncbi:hypothetical protein RAD15_02420 [Bradyrhizobium sp. 14AA]